MKILVIDNYDSFTYNLVHIIKEHAADVSVIRNDKIEPTECLNYNAIILSPGPGIPEDAGNMPEIISTCAGKVPILGICLGHQALAEYLGAKLYNLPEVFHGVKSEIKLSAEQSPLFEGLEDNFEVGRYHSWAIDPKTLNDNISVSGEIVWRTVSSREHSYAQGKSHLTELFENDSSRMKEILQYLFNQKTLSRAQSKQILGDISEGKFNHSEISSFLTVFRMRSISLDELSGFRDCLRERCNAIDLKDFDPIDLCGTGGDGKDTFNISTLASFVVAGAGFKVAKHGNYGVSSVCGSSNVMEHLGFQFSNDPDRLKRQINQAGITFLHAPLFHPAMKEVAPVRKSLGVRTFFNMLGPMVNPSFPKKQLVGVYSLQLQRYYKYIYEQEAVSYNIVHSLDGYDEISLTGQAKIISPLKEYLLKPSDLIEKELKQEDLFGGRNIDEAVGLFQQILNGAGSSAQKQAVCANAALAIQCYKPEQSLHDCFAEANKSLESGNAASALKKLLAI